MDKKKNIPEIRFKGFTDDWVESIFNNTFKSLSNNTLSRADLNYESGLAKNIHYGDVLIKFKEILDVESNEIPFISNNELVDKFRASKLQNGDIIFADAAEDETVGKCTEIININNEVVYPGLHTIAVRPTYSFASKYLGYHLNSPAYHNQLLRLIQGTKVSSISKSAIKDTSIIHPKDTTEQKQIGTFFQNLDNLITLHQKKYDKLVVLKKAMLEKMFPKKGALVPEIRFKGFTEDWIEMRLGDFAQIKRGLTYSPIDVANKGIKVLRSSNILEDTFVQKHDDVYVNENAINIDFVQENDILITSANGSSRLVGKHAIIKNLKIKAVHGGFMLIARTKYPFFLNASMSSPWYRKFINMNMAGGNGAIGNLKCSDVEEHDILTPQEAEQQKIGKYFQNLDSQIDLHNSQQDKLNTIKKACFSKMFVTQD
jgi:type I restriction enzyme S subunit